MPYLVIFTGFLEKFSVFFFRVAAWNIVCVILENAGLGDGRGFTDW
jgi:hypothetical protein